MRKTNKKLINKNKKTRKMILKINTFKKRLMNKRNFQAIIYFLHFNKILNKRFNN